MSAMPLAAPSVPPKERSPDRAAARSIKGFSLFLWQVLISSTEAAVMAYDNKTPMFRKEAKLFTSKRAARVAANPPHQRAQLGASCALRPSELGESYIDRIHGFCHFNGVNIFKPLRRPRRLRCSTLRNLFPPDLERDLDAFGCPAANRVPCRPSTSPRVSSVLKPLHLTLTSSATV